MQTFKRKAVTGYKVEDGEEVWELKAGLEYDTSASASKQPTGTRTQQVLNTMTVPSSHSAVEFTKRDTLGDLMKSIQALREKPERPESRPESDPVREVKGFDLFDSEGQQVFTGNWVEYAGKQWVVGKRFQDGVLILRRTSRFRGRKEQVVVNYGHVKCAGE